MKHVGTVASLNRYTFFTIDSFSAVDTLHQIRIDLDCY